MNDTKEDIVIFIKKRPDWFILFNTGAWIILAPIIAIYLAFLFYTGEKPKENFVQIVFPIFVIIGEILAIKIFLWHYRGKEKVTMTTEILRIERIGSILNFPDTYKLEKIRCFSLAEKKWLENMFNGYKLSGGEIQFLYFGEVIKFGQSLEREEAKEIIRILNKRLNNEPLTAAITNGGF
jgi:hypothetical protein